MAARLDRLVHLLEHFLQLLLGEVALFQLINHFLERLHGDLGLALVQLFGQVLAQLRLLFFEFLNGLGHSLHFFQVVLGDFQIFEELVDLAVLERLDGLLEAGQGKPQLLGLLGQVGQGLRHLFLLLPVGRIIAGQTRRRLLKFLQFLLQFVQGIWCRVRIAQLFLHRINLLLQIGVGG